MPPTRRRDPEPSPYYPSSRRFRDPLYLAVENVPGYRFLATELAPLARAGRALNGSSTIDRAEVRRHKLAALERLWRASPAEGASRGPQADGTDAAWPDLRRWGVFAALSEEHGPGWQAWPAELRDPRASASGARLDAWAIALPFMSGCSGCSTISWPRRVASCG